MTAAAHVLEICVDSVASAAAAQDGGADRIELCSGLSVGGLTPSLGLLRAVRARVTLPVHVLIRPREANFVYSEEEFDVMWRDITIAKENGADGVVLGLLTQSADVDVERTADLVALARPMSVTYHRAIDLARSPMGAMGQIVSTGADRVLTSGAASSAVQGSLLIRELIAFAEGRLTVMVGGGVRPENVAELAGTTGATEWHSSLRSCAARRASELEKDGLLAEFEGVSDHVSVAAEDVRRMRLALSVKQTAA